MPGNTLESIMIWKREQLEPVANSNLICCDMLRPPGWPGGGRRDASRLLAGPATRGPAGP